MPFLLRKILSAQRNHAAPQRIGLIRFVRLVIALHHSDILLVYESYYWNDHLFVTYVSFTFLGDKVQSSEALCEGGLCSITQLINLPIYQFPFAKLFSICHFCKLANG